MSEGVLPLSLASSSEGVTLSSELPTVSEESMMEQATTPAKMSDKELRIRIFFHNDYTRKILEKVMPKPFGKLEHKWQAGRAKRRASFPVEYLEKGGGLVSVSL